MSRRFGESVDEAAIELYALMCKKEKSYQNRWVPKSDINNALCEHESLFAPLAANLISKKLLEVKGNGEFYRTNENFLLEGLGDQIRLIVHKPYTSLIPKVMVRLKTLIQFCVGAALTFILVQKGILEFIQTSQWVQIDPNTQYFKNLLSLDIFSYTAAALGISAGVELGYMLFTDGPDEAISPVMLCVASAAFYSLSEDPTGSWILGIYSISLLVLIYCIKKYRDWKLED